MNFLFKGSVFFLSRNVLLEIQLFFLLSYLVILS